MTRIWVIAANTFRQSVRQRLFYNVIVFGVGMVLLSMVVGQITFGYPDRVVRSIGLSGVSIALDLVALLLGVTMIHQEIDRKTLFVVLTRPVDRWQYVFGRYLGLVLTLVLALAGFVAVFITTMLMVRGAPSIQDAIALASCLPEAAILGGVGLLLSAFSTPTLSSGLGLGIWIASSTTDDFVRLTEKADAFTKALAQVTYYVLPSLERFNFREFAIQNNVIPPAHFASALLYGALYCLALAAIASLILGRREMI